MKLLYILVLQDLNKILELIAKRKHYKVCVKKKNSDEEIKTIGLQCLRMSPFLPFFKYKDV